MPPNPTGATDLSSRLLTVEDVAKLLSVSERHVYQLAKDRRIPHTKPDGVSIRFTEDHVRQFIEDGYRPVVKP